MEISPEIGNYATESRMTPDPAARDRLIRDMLSTPPRLEPFLAGNH